MKPAPFAYARPETLEAALALLAEAGDEARILAGGQSLAAMLNMRIVTPSLLVDINRIDGLDRFGSESDAVVTGATVRQADALRSAAIAARVPLLAAALPHVGHYQTRNRGTLCGSIAHADPAAELPLVLMVTDGAIELASRRGKRRVPARQFFRGALTTMCKPDEMIVALRWPADQAISGAAFREFSIRHGDYAIAAAACHLRLRADGRIESLALGLAGVADRPVLVATAAFSGAVADEKVANEAGSQARRTGDPHDDLHATAAYRRHLAEILGRNAVAAALRQATEKLRESRHADRRR